MCVAGTATTIFWMFTSTLLPSCSLSWPSASEVSRDNFHKSLGVRFNFILIMFLYLEGSVCLFTSLSVEKHLAVYYNHLADKVISHLADKAILHLADKVTR